MSSFELIWDLARQIPWGKVATYGQLARLAGNPRWARVVGYAMHACPADVPWHRVVNRRGEVLPGHDGLHRRRLEAEGVPFTDDGRVDLERAAWLPL